MFIEGGCLTDQMRRIDALGKKEHPLGLFFIKKDWVSCSDAIAQEIAVVVRHRRNTPLPRKRSKILLLFRCKGESETSFDLVSDKRPTCSPHHFCSMRPFPSRLPRLITGRKPS